MLSRGVEDMNAFILTLLGSVTKTGCSLWDGTEARRAEDIGGRRNWTEVVAENR